jgi:hypothetical protein
MIIKVFLGKKTEGSKQDIENWQKVHMSEGEEP